jgi:hypothetical protein
MTRGQTSLDISIRLAFAAGASVWLWAIPSCSSGTNTGSPEAGTVADSSTLSDGGLEDSTAGDSTAVDSAATTDAADEGMAETGADSSSADAEPDVSLPLACLPDASDNYPPNTVGDTCRTGPEQSCFAAVAGTWNCTIAGSSVTFTQAIGMNGYTYLNVTDGEHGAHCMDCAGNWTGENDSSSAESSAVSYGTFLLAGDAGTDAAATASINWHYCQSGTVQACIQSIGTASAGTCTRASCIVP